MNRMFFHPVLAADSSRDVIATVSDEEIDILQESLFSAIASGTSAFVIQDFERRYVWYVIPKDVLANCVIVIERVKVTPK